MKNRIKEKKRGKNCIKWLFQQKIQYIKNTWSAKILLYINLERKKRKEEKVVLSDYFKIRYNNQECLEC